MIEITRAYALSRGIDLSQHECTCEPCQRSAALCTATQGSIAEELGMADPHVCHEPWFDDDLDVCQPCKEEWSLREWNRIENIKPEPDDGTTDIAF